MRTAMKQAAITDNGGYTLTSLAEVNHILAHGGMIALVNAEGTELRRFRAASQDVSNRSKSIYVDGKIARSFETVLSCIDGESPSKQTVQWFDGVKFHRWF